jgi:peptide/nickel transport system substrate-binding protein
MNRTHSLSAGCLAAGILLTSAATAFPAEDARAKTLMVVVESGPNSMDIHGVGTNRPAYGMSWNIYDRLLTYGTKTLPDGTPMYDYSVLKPELAESWTVAPNGLSVTFKLRKDATFHDGSPVTAKDVKWSFDRAVTVGGFPTFQMKAGSLEKPEQFTAVDAHTFKIDFLRKDKLTLPDLGVPVAAIYNSELCKKHVTPADPWAMDWLKNNAAGGGAYKIEAWKPGQQTIYARFEEWKSGPLPKLKRIVVREVPSAASQMALLERGDADVVVGLAPKDFKELAAAGKFKVAAVPVENALQYVGMNVSKPPFDNAKVRQAVAYALPYEKIFETAQYGRGIPLYGSDKPVSASWPQAHGYRTDLEKAKKLMAEAGVTSLETTLSFDQGLAIANEPMALLVQEALGKIGIKVTIEKIPGANWRGALLKKDMPMVLNVFGGWLNYPEYFFFWTYHGQNAVFNTMSYQNPAFDKLVDSARFEDNAGKYSAQIKAAVKTVYADVPRIPLFQPFQDVAMQKNITGYQYWFHRQLDFRQMDKGLTATAAK